ncbi:MAG TPA: O-antigen ligase family protein [Flavobacteriales bacterium]|nr:O-antigen ligase family protein [Flavobacteriales bacterium]
MIFPLKYTRWFYYTGLLGIIAGMSLSKPAVSTGIIMCGVLWVSELDFANRLKRLKNQPFFWISLALILLHVVGLFWSENMQYAVKDIKTKLPLIVLPFIFSTSKAVDLRNEWKYIYFVFIGSLIACTFLSFGIYFHWIKPAQFTEADMRTMIFGVSGVRLALFICLAICFLFYGMYKTTSNTWRLVYIIIAGWFLFFLNFIESGTAIVFLLVLFLFSLVYVIWKKFGLKWRIIFISAIVIGFFAGAYVVYNTVSGLFVLKEAPVKSTHSKYGEIYYFDKSLNYIENGYVVGKYIAWVELELAWQQRSKIPFKGRDKLHQSIYATILRYLNSKGGVKDKEALDKLTEQDIRNIENGIANASYLEMYGWQRRLLQIVYEFVSYGADRSNPFGNSVTQRFEYWRIGWNLFKQSPLIGLGTGDVDDAYDEVYKHYKFEIEHRHKLRAHNQYLTMAITFGIIGFIVFMVYAFSMLWVKGYKKYRYVALSFFIIMLFSFLSEDTLETQSGVTFIAFFHTFFNLRSSENQL